jgi:hypothetical protein
MYRRRQRTGGVNGPPGNETNRTSLGVLAHEGETQHRSAYKSQDCGVVAITNRRTEGMAPINLSRNLPTQPRPQIGPSERPCMLIKPCFREHPGWEFGNDCSAGRHFDRRKAILGRHAVGHLRSPWPEKAVRSVPVMRSRRQHRNLLSHGRVPRHSTITCQGVSYVPRIS